MDGRPRVRTLKELEGTIVVAAIPALGERELYLVAFFETF